MSLKPETNEGPRHAERACYLWVLDTVVQAATLERLADARRLADSAGEGVAALIIGSGPHDAKALIEHGADQVWLVNVAAGQNTFVSVAEQVLWDKRPRVVFASGATWGRECACRLAARTGWRLVSPALQVRSEDGELVATALDPSGRRAKEVAIASGETAIVTLRAGVAEALPRDFTRQGIVHELELPTEREQVVSRRMIPADPAAADIRDVERLVAGGRGLGGPEGFARLQTIAGLLRAGVAASRAAVDLGWIEHGRQVGQTGKTVKPELYLACGISGASHHLEGMSESAHVIAINTDSRAPIHGRAHLSLVADLYAVLDRLEIILRGRGL